MSDETFKASPLLQAPQFENSHINLDVRIGVVESYVGISVVLGQVRVTILDDQPSSQLLHFQTVHRLLRINILRALPADQDGLC
jgi:hypothetical protein